VSVLASGDIQQRAIQRIIPTVTGKNYS